MADTELEKVTPFAGPEQLLFRHVKVRYNDAQGLLWGTSVAFHGLGDAASVLAEVRRKLPPGATLVDAQP